MNNFLPFVYCSAALLSLLLLIGCLTIIRKNRKWFVVLFSSVFVVNTGYSILAFSCDLQMALMANRIAYLGSVFLPLSMLIIILKVTNTSYKKFLPSFLICLSILIFLIAASPGILNIYYRSVSFEVVNGVATLKKVYGPLHPVYLIYLVGYFGTMIWVIIRSYLKKTIENTAHAIILAIAVFVNICVWFIEQIASINFEMLSISYIISELFLLGVHMVVKENQKLKELVRQIEKVKRFSENENSAKTDNMPTTNINFDAQKIEMFISGVEELTSTEKIIYDCYIKRLTTKEILLMLNIKENTLKYHNKNIYGKLGVNSRKEILEIHKQIKIINNV